MSNNQGGANHEASDALDGLCFAMMEEFDRKPPAAKAPHKHASREAAHHLKEQ
jgi:hypothetical protein